MPESIQFSINTESSIALYTQIQNQVQFAVASGVLGPGDRLPTVRDLSEMLHTNPNTVAKAYRDLQVMQMVTTRRGVGVTVSKKAPKLCRTKMRAMVTAHLVEAVAECAACGIDKSEILAIVEKTLASKRRPYEA